MTHRHPATASTASTTAPARRPGLLGATGLALAVVLTACGSGDDGDESSSETTTVNVGVSPVPHGELMQFIDDNLAEEAGIDIEISEFDDFQLPNRALDEGSVDANYYQHLPFLQQQEEELGYDFEHGEVVHIEPYAAFSQQHESVEDIPDGATIGITNDPGNQPRALQLLESAGLLENIEDDAAALTLTDEQNPKGLEFEENQPEILAQVLGDPQIDLAILNGNFFLEAELNVEDALIVEDGADSQYANFLVWRSGEKTDAIETLDELMHSEEVATYMEETYPDGEVLPAF